MTTRSLTLAAGQVVARSQVPVYPCPNARHVIVKSVALYSDVATPIEAELLVYRPSIGVGVIFILTELTIQDPFYWEGWIVIQPGDVLYLNSAGGATNYWISGAELPQPPA